jgi:uncharacterized protein GlcG (DUF336 family)
MRGLALPEPAAMTEEEELQAWRDERNRERAAAAARAAGPQAHMQMPAMRGILPPAGGEEGEESGGFGGTVEFIGEPGGWETAPLSPLEELAALSSAHSQAAAAESQLAGLIALVSRQAAEDAVDSLRGALEAQAPAAPPQGRSLAAPEPQSGELAQAIEANRELSAQIGALQEVLGMESGAPFEVLHAALEALLENPENRRAVQEAIQGH